MTKIAQFALVKWINNNKFCKTVQLAINISINNVYKDGKQLIHLVHYAEVLFQGLEHSANFKK